VARLPDGTVEVDPTGKGPGRGAYVCRNTACWERADLAERLGRALKTTLTGDDREELAVFAANLPEDADSG
jgi:predicted RNA-binding protein YlxR (DUF448 family)